MSSTLCHSASLKQSNANALTGCESDPLNWTVTFPREVPRGKKVDATFLPGLWTEQPSLPVQFCANKSDCFVKHQPGMAGCGWLELGRTFSQPGTYFFAQPCARLQNATHSFVAKSWSNSGCPIAIAALNSMQLLGKHSAQKQKVRAKTERAN